MLCLMKYFPVIYHYTLLAHLPACFFFCPKTLYPDFLLCLLNSFKIIKEGQLKNFYNNVASDTESQWEKERKAEIFCG